MPDTRTLRLNTIADDYFESQGLYTIANSIRAIAEQRDGLLKALRLAEQFIANGVDLGYIRMPDPETPDSAHDTLPTIRAALAKATA